MPGNKIIRNFLAKFGLAERRCAHCLAPFVPDNNDRVDLPSLSLCAACLRELAPYAYLSCASCGRPVTPNSLGLDGRPQCDDCRLDPPPWDAVSCYGIYKDALKDLVLRLKFGGDLAVASLFADFLFYICKNLPRPDLVIPVPQYPSRTRERGYNQANEIARIFAKKSRLVCRSDILIRIKRGLPQEKLNARRRKENLKGAFACRQSLSGLAVWLIDDVFTTGSTCRESVFALRGAGVAETRVVFVGRTDS